jgi:hypothetical protein
VSSAGQCVHTQSPLRLRCEGTKLSLRIACSGDVDFEMASSNVVERDTAAGAGWVPQGVVCHSVAKSGAAPGVDRAA